MAEDQMQMLEVMVTYLPGCTPFESQRLRRLLRQSLCFPQVVWWAKVVSNHRRPACKLWPGLVVRSCLFQISSCSQSVRAFCISACSRLFGAVLEAPVHQCAPKIHAHRRSSHEHSLIQIAGKINRDAEYE